MRLLLSFGIVIFSGVLVTRSAAVEGKVFMSSRAGEALPLEGAWVRAFDAAAFRKLVSRSDAARKKYEKLGAKLSTLFEEAGDIPNQSVSEYERTQLLERNSTDTRNIAGEIEAYAFHFLAAMALKPIAETKSDAEGHYALAIPDVAKVVIVATAERSMGTTLDHPCWIVFAPPPDLNFTPTNRTKKMPWEVGL